MDDPTKGEPLFSGEFRLEPQQGGNDLPYLPTLTYSLLPERPEIKGDFTKSTTNGKISYHIAYREKSKPTEWEVKTDLMTLQWSSFPTAVADNDQGIYVAIVDGYKLTSDLLIYEEGDPNKPLAVSRAFYLVAATTSKPNPEATEGLLHWSTAKLRFLLSRFPDPLDLKDHRLYYTRLNGEQSLFLPRATPIIVQTVRDANGAPITVPDPIRDTSLIGEPNPNGDEKQAGLLGAYLFCKPK